MVLHLSHAPHAIRTTAALFTIVAAPSYAYTYPAVIASAAADHGGDPADATTNNPELLQFDDDHNRAIFAALAASQTEISGPIFID